MKYNNGNKYDLYVHPINLNICVCWRVCVCNILNNLGSQELIKCVTPEQTCHFNTHVWVLYRYESKNGTLIYFQTV